jgi:multicomponent Na+:H+ antiporter subunit F
MTGLEFQTFAVDLAFPMVMGAVVLAFLRLARGPSLSDRVVALDMMTVLIVAFCGLFAISTGVPAFLDVAAIVALIGFLATVALARYVERRTVRERREAGGGASGEGGPLVRPGEAEPAVERGET